MKDLPWLADLWRSLLRLEEKGTFPQAVLLIAQDTTAITKLMATLTKTLLCVSEERPCGKCASCLLWEQTEQHPDNYVLSKEKEILSIEEIRDIAQGISQTTHQGGKRFIQLSLHRLSPVCNNALLKMIEEPPPHTHFLLHVVERASLLPTLLSRCIVIDVPPPSWSQVKEWMREECSSVSEETLYWSYCAAAGAPFKALQLLKPFSHWPSLREALYQKRWALLLSQEPIQHWLKTYPEEVLSLLYHWVAEQIKAFALKGQFYEPFFVFQEAIIEALGALSTPGINKLLLLESVLSRYEPPLLQRETLCI